VSPLAITVTMTGAGAFRAHAEGSWIYDGTVEGTTVSMQGHGGQLSAFGDGAEAPCSRVDWTGDWKWWCRMPHCDYKPPTTATTTPRPPAPPGAPNIVLILTDDQDVKMESLSVMNNVHSLLQAEGTTVADFFVTTPVCCPSRSSILSGRLAHNTGAMNNGCGRGVFWKGPGMEHDLPVLLRSAGYWTGIFGKELNSVDANYMSPGWDRYFVLGDECNYFGNWWADQGVKNKTDPDLYMTHAIGNTTIEWLRAAPRPFFAYVAPHAPHHPATPAREHAGAFSDRLSPRFESWNASCPDHHYVISSQPPLTQGQAEESDAYYGKRLSSLLAVDDMVGGIVSYLEEQNELDNTFVIYTSDHGYKTGHWRIPAHKVQPYETDLRVPFIVRGPGIPRNQILKGTVGLNVDITPTLVDIAGAQSPSLDSGFAFDGRSILPQLLGQVQSRARDAFVFEYRGSDLSPTYAGGCANPMGHWLDMKNNTYHGLRVLNGTHDLTYVEFDDDVQFRELFDLSTDPEQVRNVVKDPSYSNVVSELGASLQRLRTCKADGVSCQVGGDVAIV